MSLNMWDMTDDEQEMLKQLTQPQLQEPPNKRPRTSGSSSVPEIDPINIPIESDNEDDLIAAVEECTEADTHENQMHTEWKVDLRRCP